MLSSNIPYKKKYQTSSQIKDYDVNDIGYLEAEGHLSVLYTMIRCKQLDKIEVNKQVEDWIRKKRDPSPLYMF